MKKKTRININTSLKIYIKVLLSIIFKQGKKNENIFRKAIKKFFHTENILLTAQGKVAAYNIFKVIISKKKKEILICPYTLTEIINAIIYAGGKPVYVEINIRTGLPLETDLESKINPKTAGLVMTHLYSNKKDILDFQKKYKKRIKIVEDVAINFGAKINQSKYLGTIFDYGFYSFGVMKNLCTFNGGAIYCKNKSKFNEIEQNLKKNINYPTILSLRLLLFCSLIDFFYSKYVYKFFTYYILKLSINKIEKFIYPGLYPKLFKKIPNHYNFKFQNNFAIAGIENLKILKFKNRRRIEKVKLYEKYLDKSLRINYFNYYDINSFLEYPILLNKNTNKLLSEKLLENGYDIRHTWYINSVKFLKLNFSIKKFPNCEYLHKRVLCLPTHDQISKKDIIKISKFINFYEK